MPDQHSKYSFIKQALSERKQDHRFRQLTAVSTSLHSPEIEIEGKKLINFCSNDYLGLSVHPRVLQRSKEYLLKYGSGAASSRLISGTFPIHSELEEKISATLGLESALIFNSGFQANVAILSAIADRNSLILMDKKSHNSLVQGAILSRATIKRFHHNDVEHLQSLLEHTQNKGYNRTIICSETVFSMDGDRSRLDDLIALSRHYQAFLYSDDAHALGILGEKGLGLNYGKIGIDISIGTFGKSFGGFGAFVGCSKDLKEYLINFASGFIYTTALPPAVIGGIDAALDLIPSMEKERAGIQEMIEYFKSELSNSFDMMDSNSQIIPLLIGKEKDTIELSNYLQESGLWVSSIRPPTVEKDASRLRITLTARHQKAHIDRLIKALKKWKHG